jgi:hypothetical protein
LKDKIKKKLLKTINEPKTKKKYLVSGWTRQTYEPGNPG